MILTRTTVDLALRQLSLFLSSLLMLVGVTLVGGTICLTGAPADRPSERLYKASLSEVTAAVTNAFASRRYFNMAFLASHGHYDPTHRRWTEGPTTNEWRLYTVDSPLTTVRVGDKMFPYSAEFNITAESVGANCSKITVRTVWADVPGGREIGAHGGWAIGGKNVPPIRAEETNVLSEIENQLGLPAGAATSQPMPGKRGGVSTDANWVRKWREIGELNPNAKNDLVRAIQAETNAVKVTELLRILAAMTNSTVK